MNEYKFYVGQALRSVRVPDPAVLNLGQHRSLWFSAAGHCLFILWEIVEWYVDPVVEKNRAVVLHFAVRCEDG